MRALITLFTLAVLICSAHAQTVKPERIIDSSAVWNKGEITLADTKQISGLVRYNRITSLLQYENGSDSRSFTPAGVLAFTYYDSLVKKQRKFISYGFENLRQMMDSVARARQISSIKIAPRFFEVLMEFPSFAVLSTTGQLSVQTSNGSVGSINPIFGVFNLAAAKQPSTTYSYSETLYVFDQEGQVSPLLFVFNREKDGLLFDMNQTMRMGKMARIVIQRYTGVYFSQVDEYAFANTLSYEKKEDILKLFEFYRTLIRP